ncbi:putative dsRNA-specific ribonuclease III [Namao virus]|nr:putative dsRNA-specific ribonuclease III [Namao virus]
MDLDANKHCHRLKKSYPFNPMNVLITEKDVHEILLSGNAHLPKGVRDIKNFQIAMTHQSYTYKDYGSDILDIYKLHYAACLPLQQTSYERLEFLGDNLLKTIISSYIFIRYQYESEGFLTKLKTKLENRKMFAYFSQLIGLNRFILLSAHIENNNGRKLDCYLEDVFEAFIGALYVDQNYNFDLCHSFIVHRFLDAEVDYAELIYYDRNFKDMLLRFYHNNKWAAPQYEYVQYKKPDDKIVYFKVKLTDGFDKVFETEDVSKKKAEQKCAMILLLHYNIISLDQIKSYML